MSEERVQMVTFKNLDSSADLELTYAQNSSGDRGGSMW
jgi:hypothetical protein